MHGFCASGYTNIAVRQEKSAGRLEASRVVGAEVSSKLCFHVELVGVSHIFGNCRVDDMLAAAHR